MGVVNPQSATIPAMAFVPASAPAPRAPMLPNGDRLTRAEFERRYIAMPQVKHAELIEGIVYTPSPVRLAHHGEPHARLIGWISHFVAKTPGIRCGDNATSRLDEDNEPQPDVMLLLPAGAGSSAVVDADGFVSGAPDLVCEVAASSVSIDMHAKLNAYRRNGVREYLVWRVEDGAIDWFELVDGRYVALPVDEGGVVRSRLFPGLWLDLPAMLRGDLAAVFFAVEQGTSTAEHGALKDRIASAKT
ncbi:MAG TPA: Uma2 family endonuclease [Lacipirellulaceae bacterium]|nr:Uma2 family endonuclease [Lacipirellulaceae bacterium]